jgi:ubiquitin-large subunit ribosomal protein L40e
MEVVTDWSSGYVSSQMKKSVAARSLSFGLLNSRGWLSLFALLCLALPASLPADITVDLRLPGETFPLQLESSDTVGELKERLQQAKGFAPDLQRVVFAGAVRADTDTFGQLGIKNGSRLDVFLAGQGTPSFPSWGLTLWDYRDDAPANVGFASYYRTLLDFAKTYGFKKIITYITSTNAGPAYADFYNPAAPLVAGSTTNFLSFLHTAADEIPGVAVEAMIDIASFAAAPGTNNTSGLPLPDVWVSIVPAMEWTADLAGPAAGSAFTGLTIDPEFSRTNSPAPAADPADAYQMLANYMDKFKLDRGLTNLHSGMTFSIDAVTLTFVNRSDFPLLPNLKPSPSLGTKTNSAGLPAWRTNDSAGPLLQNVYLQAYEGDFAYWMAVGKTNPSLGAQYLNSALRDMPYLLMPGTLATAGDTAKPFPVTGTGTILTNLGAGQAISLIVSPGVLFPDQSQGLTWTTDAAAAPTSNISALINGLYTNIPSPGLPFLSTEVTMKWRFPYITADMAKGITLLFSAENGTNIPFMGSWQPQTFLSFLDAFHQLGQTTNPLTAVYSLSESEGLPLPKNYGLYDYKQLTNHWALQGAPVTNPVLSLGGPAAVSELSGHNYLLQSNEGSSTAAEINPLRAEWFSEQPARLTAPGQFEFAAVSGASTVRLAALMGDRAAIRDVAVLDTDTDNFAPYAGNGMHDGWEQSASVPLNTRLDAINGPTGLSNAMLYALGINPSTAQRANLPALVADQAGAYGLDFTVNRLATRGTVTVEQSDDLRIWRPAPFLSLTGRTGLLDHVRVMSTAGASKRFFRVRAESNPRFTLWVERDDGDQNYYNGLLALLTNTNEPLQFDKVLVRLADPDLFPGNFNPTTNSLLYQFAKQLGDSGWSGELALIPDFTTSSWSWQPPGQTIADTNKWQKAFYWVQAVNPLLPAGSLKFAEVVFEKEASGIPGDTNTYGAIRAFRNNLWTNPSDPDRPGLGVTGSANAIAQFAWWTSDTYDTNGRLVDAAYPELYNLYKTVSGTTYLDAYAASASLPGPSPALPHTIYTLSRSNTNPVSAILGDPSDPTPASTFGFLVGQQIPTNVFSNGTDLTRVHLLFSAEWLGAPQGSPIIDAFGTWTNETTGVNGFLQFAATFRSEFGQWWQRQVPRIGIFEYEYIPASWRAAPAEE